MEMEFLALLRPGPRWRLQGYDAFSGEHYPIRGTYGSEASARRAGYRYLRRLEKMQPSESSGGQHPGGIQDQVYLISPEGCFTRLILPQDRLKS